MLLCAIVASFGLVKDNLHRSVWSDVCLFQGLEVDVSHGVTLPLPDNGDDICRGSWVPSMRPENPSQQLRVW